MVMFFFDCTKFMTSQLSKIIKNGIIEKIFALREGNFTQSRHLLFFKR